MKQIAESEMVNNEREFVEFWRHPFTLRLLMFLRGKGSGIRESIVPAAPPDKVQYWIGFADGLVAALESGAPECMQKNRERLQEEISARQFSNEIISEEVADGAASRGAVDHAPAEPENRGDGGVAGVHGGKRRLVARDVSAAFRGHNGKNPVSYVPTRGKEAGNSNGDAGN